MNQVSPPDPAEVLAAVRAGLSAVLPAEDLAQVDLDALDLQTPLLSLPVDSATLMALMNHLEDTFTVFIEEEAAFSFTTISDIADYIRRRIANRPHRIEGP